MKISEFAPYRYSESKVCYRDATRTYILFVMPEPADLPKGPDYEAMTDEKLILFWQDEQDERAAAITERRWWRRLIAFFCGSVPRATAEDLTQETLLRVFCSGAFREGYSFAAWIMTIAGNVLIDYYRRTGRLREIALETDDDSGPSLMNTIVSSAPSPDRQLAESQFYTVLYACVMCLTPRARSVVLLRAVGVPNQDIAQSLGVTGGPASIIFHNACAALRVCLKAKGYETAPLTGPQIVHTLVMIFAEEKVVYTGRAPRGGQK